MPSRLLDLRDCARPEFAAIHRDMLRLDLRQQPRWFRPLLRRSLTLKRWTGYDHWSRAWEYPWAVLAADLPERPLRVLDVGGGGSPFAPYLAERGHACTVADPSLDRGRSFVFDPERGLWRNLRSAAKRALFRAAGLHGLWGLPAGPGRTGIRHASDPADRLSFADGAFDRVFCLSVMEHIPAVAWPACMRQMTRVLAPGGRLVLTLDMTREEADARRYLALVEAAAPGLRLLGDPAYATPIAPEDAARRHPGHGYETIGLVWSR
jgi:SAM-dependent methyltransferase